MTRTAEAHERTRPPAFGWADAPRLGIADLFAMLWNERLTVLAVGAVICAIGLALAILAPKSYTARAELLVRLGQEYVFQPGGGQPGVPPDIQSVVNAEMRMLGSGAVVRRAITDVGLPVLYPEIAAGSGSAAAKLSAAERALAQHLTIETAPQTPSIALSFKHENPEIAAKALNALIDAYLARRRDVLVGGEYEALARQSGDLDLRVAETNAALAAFLSQNGIADFETEKTALAQRAADIETQALDAETRRREADARAAALRSQISAEPEQIELYSESDARRALVQAQLEREQLLSRYQEDALPVREVDRRIAQLELFLSGGEPASLTRRGPNPVRQDIATQLYAQEAEARAQRGRIAALTQQRTEVAARLHRMQEMEPEFRRLLRERTILEQNAQSFASRAEEARAFSQLLGRSTDNISPVERAHPPTQGQSLRVPIAAVTVLLAGLFAAAAGVARGLARRSFPTPSSAARTLGAPVLAVAPKLTRKAEQAAKQPSPRAAPALKLVKS